MQITPAAPGSNPLLTLLDLVETPLLLFQPDGRVVFSNQAARADPSRPSLVLGSDPQVRAIVRDIAAGTSIPVTDLRLDALSDAGAVGLTVRFAPKPVAGLIAATARSTTAAASPAGERPVASDERLSLQQVVEVLRGELLPPMQAVLAQPDTALPAHGAAVEHLRERLDRLVDLVDVFGDDVLISDERMVIPDLVRATCQALAPLLQASNVSVVFKGEKADLPPVYGSERLLRRALQECLHNAVAHSRAQIQANQHVGVEVAFRAAGHHLLVSISNMGALSTAALQRHAATLFRVEPATGSRKAGEAPVLQIGLPLAHRILQLHGGGLRIEDDRGEGLTVMLELPTGAPLRNTRQLDLLQAQIYAEDLSTLMARTRARSTT